jgi:hypothetical protein
VNMLPDAFAPLLKVSRRTILFTRQTACPSMNVISCAALQYDRLTANLGPIAVVKYLGCISRQPAAC